MLAEFISSWINDAGHRSYYPLAGPSVRPSMRGTLHRPYYRGLTMLLIVHIISAPARGTGINGAGHRPYYRGLTMPLTVHIISAPA